MGREPPADTGRPDGAAPVARAAAATRSVPLALAVVVVAGIALAAALMRPGAHLVARGRGPLGGSSGAVVALAALAVLGGLVLHGRFQRSLPHTRDLTPVEQRLADATGYAVTLAPFAVPLLVLLLHRFSAGAGGDGNATEPHPVITQSPHVLPSSSGAPPADRSGGHDLPILPVLIGLGAALLAAAVGYAAFLLWRHLRRTGPRQPQEPYDAVDDRDLLARAVDSGRRALLGDDDPRTAVIACYAAMEETLAVSGVVRRASDSPQDLLERAAAGGLLPEAGPAAELTALFREARYSRHPMDAGHRDRAAAALTEIAGHLAATAPAPEGAP